MFQVCLKLREMSVEAIIRRDASLHFTSACEGSKIAKQSFHASSIKVGVKKSAGSPAPCLDHFLMRLVRVRL